MCACYRSNTHTHIPLCILLRMLSLFKISSQASTLLLPTIPRAPFVYLLSETNKATQLLTVSVLSMCRNDLYWTRASQKNMTSPQKVREDENTCTPVYHFLLLTPFICSYFEFEGEMWRKLLVAAPLPV